MQSMPTDDTSTRLDRANRPQFGEIPETGLQVGLDNGARVLSRSLALLREGGLCHGDPDTAAPAVEYHDIVLIPRPGR
jgi:hypothetical protein